MEEEEEDLMPRRVPQSFTVELGTLKGERASEIITHLASLRQSLIPTHRRHYGHHNATSCQLDKLEVKGCSTRTLLLRPLLLAKSH